MSKIREYRQVWHVPGVGTVLELAPELVQQFFAVSSYDWVDVGFGTKTIKAYGYPRDENVYTLIEAPIEH